MLSGWLKAFETNIQIGDAKYLMLKNHTGKNQLSHFQK
jgi:hypothetical protein